MKIGDRVKVLGGMSEFVGSKGVVVGVEKNGGDPIMYRVRLDEPVQVEHVGQVEDDLWQSRFLKKIGRVED